MTELVVTIGDSTVGMKQACVKLFKGSNLIKTFVILACLILAALQIATCVTKLIYVPITTHTHFDFNKTITYPSVTFCREPPYKYDRMLEYGLYSHPRFTSAWASFNFSRIPLDRLWEEITYDDSDYFVQYGLNNERDNVIVTPTTGFIRGRCYTVSSKHRDIRATSRSQGFSVTLKHTARDIATATSVLPPGYHVYVHHTEEPYTEVEVYNGGLVDYLYVNTGETVDVKLTVDEYIKISSWEDPCITQQNYSANTCTTQHVWDAVGERVGCSGPWMLSELPQCENFGDMRNLITTYIKLHYEHDSEQCRRVCRSLLYNAFVTDRQKYYTWDSTRRESTHTDLQTHVYVHFNNMVVSVSEERFSYDWNVFLADLGGSVGFLLGLSVIGCVSLLSSIYIGIVMPLLHKKTKDVCNRSGSSSATVDVATVEDAMNVGVTVRRKINNSHF